MSENEPRYAPGRVRDAILQVLTLTSEALSVKQIEDRVNKVMGPTPASSVRSYLLLNTPALFVREDRGIYRVRSEYSGGMQREIPRLSNWAQPFTVGSATLFHADCFDWIEKQKDNSIHAVVTDPPYGLHEYAPDQQLKLRNGKGGVWRIPPAFDGHVRSPLPRFTTLTDEQREQLQTFFFIWARLLLPKLVPGANVVVASNPLLSYILSGALADAGLERRGEIIRLVMTMRGGDRPKAAHEEFEDVSVMPRSMWEPWVIFRKPIEGRVQDNLRKWKTGGFRRQSQDKPFGDVIPSSPIRKNERALAPHPSLKPQAFLRRVVRGVLPIGEGTILDPFAGTGSTLAAAESVGYRSIGIEKDRCYFELASEAIPKLIRFRPTGPG
ncbi:MAG TPA: DNA methyltransferase [Thermodesulfobacteriota bacterium]|jgi:site-specific DNA-methyltransferase (adenine-specific)|nr:DNA methyltransferase [Thermodesulfobacteriota bacterium]